MHMHECDRFRAEGFSECPFRRSKGHEDEDEEEERRRIPLALPGRRTVEGDALDNLSQFPVIAHGDPAMRKALERMAAFQNLRGLPSLPDITVPEFPFGGRGLHETAAIFAAVVIMQSLRALRATGPSPPFQAVRVSERHAARGLAQVGAPGTRGGFGGMHVNAASKLRRLMGRRRLRELGGPIAGFDAFSETGFP